MVHKLTSTEGPGRVLEVTPEIVGWDVLDFSVMVLEAAGRWAMTTGGREVAVVPQAGSFVAHVGERLCRDGLRSVSPTEHGAHG